eukprot:2444374-Prymnesium_polylepis.1
MAEAAERRARRGHEKAVADAQAAQDEAAERLLRERAAHGRALRVVQAQAAADLDSAREAWAQERWHMHEALEMLRGRAGLPPGASVLQFRERATAIARENQRLLSRAAAAEQQLAAAQGELEVRDGALASLETSLAAVHSAGAAPSAPAAASAPREAAMARQLLLAKLAEAQLRRKLRLLSLIHISEPTRRS